MKKYWNTIRKNFPKAFAELVNNHNTIELWGYIDIPEIWGEIINEEQYVLRHLFDFFDSCGINGYCYTSNSKKWAYAILTKEKFMTASEKFYNSREKAELACWKKCFEKLELQIQS